MKHIRYFIGILSVLFLTLLLVSCGCDHEFGPLTELTAPTCSSEGIQQTVCSKCGEIVQASVGKIDHVYGEWTVTKEATCVTSGIESKSCNVCGEVKEREIPKTDSHSYGEWITSEAPTCSTPGTLVRSCAICGYEESKIADKLEHTYGEWEITKKPTCTETGNKTRVCKECNATDQDIVDKNGHNFGDWKTTKVATCTDSGNKERTCSHCSEKETAEIDPKGHSWKNATCATPKTCSVCGQTTGGVGDHTWSAATCTKAKSCSICGKSEGNALGHNTGTNGKCTRCGKEDTESILKVLSDPFDTSAQMHTVTSNQSYIFKNGNFYIAKNSADGVTLQWAARNLTNKTIKYLTFTVEFYNSVGDRVKDTISGKNTKTLQITGPITANDSFFIRSIIGYSPTCTRVKITTITIEYTDGTTVFGYYNKTAPWVRNAVS